MSEQQPHCIATEKIRKFQKLRRHYRAYEREGKPMEKDLYNEMLTLDEWLASNVFSWHQNYPDAEREE